MLVENRSFGEEVMIIRGMVYGNTIFNYKLGIKKAKSLLNELIDYKNKRLINKPFFELNTTHKDVVEMYINILENTINESKF